MVFRVVVEDITDIGGCVDGYELGWWEGMLNSTMMGNPLGIWPEEGRGVGEGYS